MARSFRARLAAACVLTLIASSATYAVRQHHSDGQTVTAAAPEPSLWAVLAAYTPPEPPSTTTTVKPAPRPLRRPRGPSQRILAASTAGHPCGPTFGLPPCWVMMRESRGDLRIWNGGCYAPIGWAGSRSPCGGSTASGKWMFLRSTWGGFGGYLNAADAPESVQDDHARITWNGGRGCAAWSACR